MTRRFILPFFLVVSLLSCRPANRSEGEAPVPQAELSLGSLQGLTPIEPMLVYVQGSPRLVRGGAESEVVEGTALREGDRLMTDAVSSAEIRFGEMAVVRVLPSSEFAVQALRSRLENSHGGVELGLAAGAVLAKVQKLAGVGEFIILTPNSAAGVRGTEFLVRYEGAVTAAGSTAARSALTRVAVRSGRVALLPKGRLLDGLLDGREANPIAGAVVATAFAFAPTAGAGEEVVVGGSTGPRGEAADREAEEAAEAAYGALVRAAENAAAAGFDLEAASEPAAFIAAPGSEAERALRRAMGGFSPSPLSAPSAALLELLDRLRDPGAASGRLPAALPLELFRAPAASASSGPAPKPAPVYPALLWSVSVSRSAIVEPLTRLGEYLVVTDAAGVVRALRQDGSVVWSAGKDVVAATALDTTLALTGAEAVAVVDGAKGEELGRWAFDGWAGTPRSKAVPVPEGVAVATPRGVAVLRAENAALVKEILVEGGVVSPPVLAGRELVAITGTGSLAIIDLGTGRVAAEIPAGLTGPALAPRYRDGRVYAADRNGRVVALDVAGRVLIWERDLGVGLLAEAETDGERVFLWTADRTLMTISSSDGGDVRASVRGVESAPLLSAGRLYWGISPGILVVAEASTGRVLKRIETGEKQSVRALMIGGTLYAGAAGGRIVKIDPEK